MAQLLLRAGEGGPSQRDSFARVIGQPGGQTINCRVIMGLGDKAAALALSERAMTVIPIEKDVVDGPAAIEILARVAAQMGEPDRAIAALQKLLSIPSEGALAARVPLTPALLRLDPMFDPLRNDPRFQELILEPIPRPL